MMAIKFVNSRQLSFDFDQRNNVTLGSIEEIKSQLPFLLTSQAEDVCRAELRFLSGKGYLFTNATGTGKTFVGLGIAKRFFDSGKRRILIVVPTDKKCIDWKSEALHFKLNVYQLQNINDFGSEVVVTTYANFYQNEKITSTTWDLIIYDESHYLNQNEAGRYTAYSSRHDEVANLPTVVKSRVKTYPYVYKKNGDTEELDNDLFLEIVRKEVEQTKVVFLSATPFAYHKSVKYADGCLFDIYETIEDQEYSGGYNEPQGFDSFLVQNFGYRMRYNRCTIPESGVDVNLLERNFFEKFRELGVMSTRQIDLPFDYSRHFVTLESKLGQIVEEGFGLFYDRGFTDKYPILCERIHRKNNFLYISQLLECIKAREIPSRIKKHLALGRKVIVFHNYNNSLPSHPFKFSSDELVDKWEYEKLRDIEKEILNFRKEYAKYWELDLSTLINVRTLLKNHFPNSIEYNGTIPKKKRDQYVQEFNSDGSDVNLMIIQVKAGQEGISLHDTTGVHQRVIINLGLPSQPPQAIQIEGRTYREGLKSNCIYEYATLQTSTERIAFAQRIAERSKTVENLAMGNLARDMETTFKEGYINSSSIDPAAGQGFGGKESDRYLYSISEFDKAKTYYYQRGKKTAATKSKEGADYFATPEPLGMKMVEWLESEENQVLCEPSAGHGAIARFFPSNTTNHFIEESFYLASELSINTKGTVHTMSFENYYKGNKFDGIAMNPPFGFAGKTAMDHVAKACDHLRWSGGTVIAIVPNGSSMNKRLEAFFSNKDNYRLRMTGEILLPTCTFERAGTSVICKIVRIQEGYHRSNWKDFRRIDLTYCNTISEFFEAIEHLTF